MSKADKLRAALARVEELACDLSECNAIIELLREERDNLQDSFDGFVAGQKINKETIRELRKQLREQEEELGYRDTALAGLRADLKEMGEEVRTIKDVMDTRNL
jgi:uncharacterized coiled-coil DUF342 family protein